MEYIYIALIALASYFILIFLVLRITVPYMGFGRLKLPNVLPLEIQNVIKELESVSSSKEEYLKNAYNFVVNKWHAGRLATIFYTKLAFRTDLKALLNEPGFAHCNTQNYLVFVLLSGSKFFKPEDVKVKTVFFNFFIHQYIRVNLDGKIIDVDPGGASIRGMPLGTHISFFG